MTSYLKKLTQIIALMGALILVVDVVTIHSNVWAKDNKEIMLNNLKTLREAAEKFAEAFAKRDYKTMYELIDPQYRSRVPLWEYKDYIDYPGVTDGYIIVEVTDVNVLPKSNYKYGKVMQKIVITENQKIKTTGETIKVNTEKWEFQDWVILDNEWYKIEKMDSN